MIISVASYKGGVGKTTTAIHLAAFLNKQASTLLVDADPNRSAMTWAALDKLPFKTVTDVQMAKHIRNYEHVVIDTQARPQKEDLKELAESCDLLILPTTPRGLDLDALLKTAETLKAFAANFKVLLTMIPPAPNKDGVEAREHLVQEEVPIFIAGIKKLTAFERAPLLGVVVAEYRDRRSGIAARGYEDLGKEIIGVE
jgi:chromosome partitioning protein